MIALIEINEVDIEGLDIPFTIYALYNDSNSTEVRALYMDLAAKRKEMSEIYKKIDKIKVDEQTDNKKP